jgi:hypothetical protein
LLNFSLRPCSVNDYPFPNAPHSPKHGTIFFGSRYGAAATSAGLKKCNSLILFYPSLYPQQPLHTARKQRKNFSPRGYYGHLKENLAQGNVKAVRLVQFT